MHFNPRSREGSDLLVRCNSRTSDDSIHAPAKGATLGFYLLLQTQNYFNPRSREGATESNGAVLRGDFHISIHAPAKGATVGLLDKSSIASRISIHAPAKGATIFCLLCCILLSYFNPRSREGERHQKSHISFQILIFI